MSRSIISTKRLNPARFSLGLNCEQLEDRLTPTVSIQFDYRYDTSGFFSDPAHRAVLERAGHDLASRLTSSLSAIAPSGGNSWTARFFNPATGGETQLPNLVVPADTVIVFVGSQNISGGEAGYGGPGGYRVGGATNWQNTVATRGQSGFSTWGGSITFDSDSNWYFGITPNSQSDNKLDFYSVAVHELGHVLGFGASSEFAGHTAGSVFTGATANAISSSAPPLASDQAHWQQGTQVHGTPVSMEPTLLANTRVMFSDLDYAALRDIGWQVTGLPGASAVTPITSPSTGTSNSADQPNGSGVSPGAGSTVPADGASASGTDSTHAGPASANNVVIASGPRDGSVRVFSGAGGQLTPTGATFQPFGNFNGAVRTVAADVNGDGVPDIIMGTGPYGGSKIRILDGRTQADILPMFSAFEESFTGGVFLAAGDFNGDGKADVVVAPDQGGGGRIRILDVSTGSARTLADFFGIEDPNFRGGVRPAVGDINGDGQVDLIVAAGFGGGPRVAIFDGRSVLGGQPVKLVNDFFAFEESLRNGVYVTVGDFNQDGRGDLAFGAGPGGGPRVLVVNGADLLANPGAAMMTPLADFFAGSEAFRGGVRLTAKDVNADGLADLVTGTGEGTTPGQVQVHLGQAGGGFQSGAALDPFGAIDLDGVYVG
ncbi:MAG: FG-GAP-like repeat-containing protein [Bacteroidales bacterium]|nr:FG-GAP-like repeat-containing protein [Bacteroidales bacterium]